MFFRGRQPETSIWKRFRGSADGFTFAEEKDYFVAHLVANAERVVDLSLALLEYLPPAPPPPRAVPARPTARPRATTSPSGSSETTRAL